MSLSEHPIQTAEAEGRPELVEVSSYASSEDGFDHGLVVLASGDAFWLEPRDDRFRLLVERHAAERAREQLASYERESLNWPPPRVVDQPAAQKIDLVTPFVWGTLVLASFWAQGEWRAWTDLGMLDAQAVFERGEAWRLLTALFLHADVGHLVSNLVSGIFVFSAVSLTIGRARGCIMIALAAVGGNIAVVALNHGNEYRSLGASTGVFAAIGLLTGRALRVVLRANHPHRWRTLFVPLGTGLTVLALYGAGGQQVDVMAHLTGFCAGLLLGLIAGGERAVSGESKTKP